MKLRGPTFIATLSLLIAAIVGMLFTLGKIDIRLPFSPEPYTLTVKLDDAAGLDSDHNPLVMVAGAKAGRVTRVVVSGGTASATLTLDPGVDGSIFKDATVAVRPTGLIPILTVDLDPGSPSAGVLPSGSTLDADRTSTYVASDKVISVLDANTRAYLQVLLSQSATALNARGTDLERAVMELDPATASTARVMEAVADRRRLVTRLVRNVNVLTTTLARRRAELGRVVDGGDQVLQVTSKRSPQLAETVRRLPATVQRAESAVRELRALAGPLNAGLDGVNPALKDLPAGLRELRASTPAVRKLVSELNAVQQIARTELPALRDFTKQLGPSSADAIPGVKDAAKGVKVLAENSAGLSQTADLALGVGSFNDANGPMTRVQFTSIEPLVPANFGLLPSETAGRNRAAVRNQLGATVAQALEERCKTQAAACLARVLTPGLPGNDAVSASTAGGTP